MHEIDIDSDIDILNHRIDELGFFLNQLNPTLIYTLPTHLFPLNMTSDFSTCIHHLKNELRRLKMQPNPQYQLFLIKQISHKINVLARHYETYHKKEASPKIHHKPFKASNYETFIKNTHANINELLTQKKAIEDALTNDKHSTINHQLERKKAIGHIEQQLSLLQDSLNNFLPIQT
jgi:hypothetical protein